MMRPEAPIEYGDLVICQNCQTAYDSTINFTEIVLPAENGRRKAVYFAGQCPSCHTIDPDLTYYSRTERALFRLNQLVNEG